MINKIYDKTKQFIKQNYKELILIIIIFFLFTIELPYSIYTPGGAVNLNDRVTVDEDNKIKGSFNMAYVSMVKGTIPFLLMSKVFPDWDVIKKDELTADGESMNELLKREKIYMDESIDCAIINAYRLAGRDITINSYNNNVVYLTREADTNLKVGDKILKVEGHDITSLAELKMVVESMDANKKLDLEIKRDNKIKKAYAKTYEVDGVVKIGVSLITTYEYDAKPEVNIKSKASEAGSSGGLMMSLTVYNKLVKEDITRGKKVVGTGTIDIDGNVGEIGGVKYKLIGAVKNKADVFICPEENYDEAIKVAKNKKYDIKIIKAKTFNEVLDKLKEL